jgi:rhamnose utilization protein RhaD (predicted bifunctional aldolase and dehydrogenase)/NAD(P)-dependent dehydrogenase (short-subunit alcohol dehydrogenase family)
LRAASPGDKCNTLNVQSRWSDTDVGAFPGVLGERVYSSRLLGAEADLVMHGGGNTSVKVTEPDLFGHPIELLYVKGSGSDLALVTDRDFAPVRLDALHALAGLERLSDTEMGEQLRLATVRADAPAPSVEAILHALIPARYVDHTHADAVLTITNSPKGRKHIEELYGDSAIVVDYVMPGFALARRCAQTFSTSQSEGTIGIVLMNHGLFSFGDSARESYDRMIHLVTQAEHYLEERNAWRLPMSDMPSLSPSFRHEIANLRNEISNVAQAPMIVEATRDSRVAAFVRRDDYARIATRGPLTPDHVIRTKRLPLVGRDVRAYADEYTRGFQDLSARSDAALQMLDPAPRIVIDPALGLLSVGRSARDAAVARDIALHTLDAIERAEMLDEWQPLGEGDLFDVEYWELEQAKLRRGGSRPPLTGDVALVTGAASGIGRATAQALLQHGAAVVGLDVDECIVDLIDDAAFLGVPGDVTDEAAIDHVLDETVLRFGGLDIAVLNAGVFPKSTRLEELSAAEWRRVMAVNVDANVVLLNRAADLLALSPRYGRVVVNASKNVHAPGPGAAAYSASKAALLQLARVAALEWAPRGVRVNVVHPNAVFDTGIWDRETIASRAASYNLTVEQYKTNNLLGVEIHSGDVANVIVALCSPTFAKTTGAQIQVDGGTDRTI